MPKRNKNKKNTTRTRARAGTTGSLNHPSSGGVRDRLLGGRPGTRPRTLTLAQSRALGLTRAPGMVRQRAATNAVRRLRQVEAIEKGRQRTRRMTLPAPTPNTGPGQNRLKRPLEEPTAPRTRPRSGSDGPVVLKRTRLISESTADLAMMAENTRNNREALSGIYEKFFEDGVPRSDWKDLLDDLYSEMGKSKTPYASEAVSDKDFQDFLDMPNALIKAQNLTRMVKDEFGDKMDAYREEMEEWQALRPEVRRRTKRPVRPENPSKAKIAKGDYFHVHNKSGLLSKASAHGRARRIIVNVNNQAAALRIAHELGGLFTDKDVSPNFTEFKVYLTQKERENARMKHDKLVIYYRTAPGDRPGEDSVGDRIADTVKAQIKPSDVGGTFAPFYARVGEGDGDIAYAEEPKYFHYALSGSFTQSREQVVSDVIKAAAESAKKGSRVPHADEFIRLVNAGLRMSFIDPRNPQRHLTDRAFPPGFMPDESGDPVPLKSGDHLDDLRTDFQRKRRKSIGKMIDVAAARRVKGGLKRSERRKKAKSAKRAALTASAGPTGLGDG